MALWCLQGDADIAIEWLSPALQAFTKHKDIKNIAQPFQGASCMSVRGCGPYDRRPLSMPRVGQGCAMTITCKVASKVLRISPTDLKGKTLAVRT